MSPPALAGTRPQPTGSFGLRDLGFVLGIAALYAVTGRLGLLLAQTQENATLIWAPTGLALAALVLLGPRHWPGVFIGAAITNATIGTPVGALVGITLGNTLEAIVGWALLTKVATLQPGFARLRDVLAFLFFGVLLSTTVSATIGVGSLALAGEVDAASFGTVWSIWWLGDAGGAAVVAPLILVVVEGRPSWRRVLGSGESWAAMLVLCGLMALAFTGVLAEAWLSLLFALLAFPIVVWVGLRLGPRGAVLAGTVAGAFAVVGTARGHGPLVGAGGFDLFVLWAYVFALGTVAMILAAAIAEAEDEAVARRRGDEERARMAEQLQHIQRLDSLGLLAGGIAHDFNNFLLAIRGNAELMKNHPELARTRGHELLGAIERASDQAAELCGQLLTYAGQSHPERAPADLEALVKEMAPLLETSTGRGVTLALETERVPAVLGDRTQLRQVVMNLVLNAAQSMGEGGGTVRIRLSTREVSEAELREGFMASEGPAGRYVVLTVTDEGCGMAPEVVERIFDPFFTTKREGRGLGMPSVLGIVRAHDAAIKVRSVVDQGSTFEVLLPVLEGVALQLAEELEPPTEEDVTEPSPDRAETVLLAEDNDHVRAVTRMVLESAGFAVVLATSGAEAVERFEADPTAIDVLLFDVKMPGMSGPAALRKIHAIAPAFPAVLMSGYDEGLTQDLPDTPFIHKPFELEELVEMLREAMRERQR